MTRLLVPLALLLTLAAPASAQTMATPAPAVPLPRGTSDAVWAGNMLYVSGALDPEIPIHPTTEQQTVGLIRFLERLLVSQQLTLGDVVMMRVYLGADPTSGKMDFAGMMRGYTQFFGTAAQPNRPARTTVQVTLPAGDRGGLIEIDLVAMKPGTGERIEVRQ